ncbi:13777_t:CDS:2, partial [Funneliformis geosporum]
DIAKLEQDKASLAEQAEEERQEILEELQNAHEKNGILFIKLQKLEDFINELILSQGHVNVQICEHNR